VGQAKVDAPLKTGDPVYAMRLKDIAHLSSNLTRPYTVTIRNVPSSVANPSPGEVEIRYPEDFKWAKIPPTLDPLDAGQIVDAIVEFKAAISVLEEHKRQLEKASFVVKES